MYKFQITKKMKTLHIYIAILLAANFISFSVFSQCGAPPQVVSSYNTCSYPSGPVTISALTVDASCSQTITHRWYTSPTGGTYISGTHVVGYGGTCALYYTKIDVAETTSYWVSNVVNGCESARVKVTGTVDKPYTPVLLLAPSTSFNGSEFSGATVCSSNGIAIATLEASGGDTGTTPLAPSTYQWYDAPTGGNLLFTGPQYSTTINMASTVNGIKTYYVGGTLTNNLGCTFPISPRKAISIKLLDYPDCQNSIDSYTPQEGTFTNRVAVQLAPHESVIKSSVYLDLLGRVEQNVNRKGSPTQADIVQPIWYDGFGREARKYKPVAITSTASGSFQPGILNGDGIYIGSAAGFYSNPNDRIADDTHPFAQTVYEPSPLNRVTKQGAPGAIWQPSTSATTYSNYYANWYFKDFVNNNPGGGGSVTVSINNNILSVVFSAGFSSTTLKTGSVKTLATSPVLHDMELGLIATDKYKASIKNGTLFIEAMTPTPAYVGGFNSTFTINLNIIDHTVKSEYLLNGSNEVLDWTYDPSTRLVNAGTAASPTYFPANKLIVLKRTDENGTIVLEYTNNEGQRLLSRVQAGATQIPVNDANYASTYYVYDDFGKLVCVIPPEASKRITSSPSEYLDKSNTEKDNFLNRWAFRYVYDARKRLVEKKKPGSETVYMVFDNRNRLVLTQDGNQRPLKEWTYTKYDRLDRPIMVGVYTHSAEINQSAMGALVSSTIFHETFNGVSSTHGYTSTSGYFPSSNIQLLKATYYDSYVFKNLSSGLNYINNDLPGQPTTELMTVKGIVTGSKTRVLGSSNYLYDAVYYDNKYRVIQTVSQNHKNGSNRITANFDFANKLQQVRRTYVVNGVTFFIDENFEYDHNGRLTSGRHSVNGQQEVILFKNEYSELGELVDKQLHSSDNGVTFAQSIDYRYNVRGWLLSINNSELTNTTNNDDDNDLFGMELAYHEDIGLNSTPQYNGNISGLKWSNNTVESNVLQRGYSFTYDQMNRVKAANHLEAIILNNWATGKFDENGINYDLNGNILSLQRRNGTGNLIDNLTYNYGTSGAISNRLAYVSDASSSSEGFTDGNAGVDDFGYDQNGNLLLDKNKGITSISYNHLNLPTQIVKGPDNVTFVYDAQGNKLTQQLVGSIQKTTDYVGELVFENNLLRYIKHREGRLLPDGSNWEYQYYIKDHLGNVRLTFSAKTEVESNTATLESANQSEEEMHFLRLAEARKIQSHLFDHTNGNAPSTVPGYAQRLNGSTNEKYGLAVSLSVMPGDVITAEVYAKYIDQNNSNWTSALNTLLGQIASGTASPGTVVDGGSYQSSTVNFPWPSFASQVTSGSSGTGPKAFLNWLVFKRDGTFLLGKSGYARISSQPKEYGQDVLHEKLTSPEIQITEPGFVYIYLSNEEGSLVEVYFDDFKVTHSIESPIVQSNDYYPFGLAFNSYYRENSTKNNHLYNGSELQDELDLNWVDYGARMHMPEVGRFYSVDPYSTEYYSISPYSYCLNSPLNAIDPDGKNVYILLPDGSMILALYTNSDHEFYSYREDGTLTKLDSKSKDRTMIGLYLMENEDMMATLAEGLSGEYKGSKGNTLKDYKRLVHMLEGTLAKDAFLEFMVDMIGGAGIVDDIVEGVVKRVAKKQAVKTAVNTVGQFHHLLSNKIVRALSKHPVLKGLFDRDDPAWIFRALDEAAHKGYQKWHRELDDRVVKWLETNPEATREDFVKFINKIYQEPDISKRIPNVKIN
jgi:RHS repeat-associated protein